MITVHYSNKTECLLDQLAVLVQQTPRSPLEKLSIVVQSAGMAKWLNMGLAERHGIAANFDFPMPSRFVWELTDKFRAAAQYEVTQDAFAKDAMVWRLMQLLPARLEDPAFAVIKRYFGLSGSDVEVNRSGVFLDHFKLYQLAQKVADLFDAYMVYRPDWLLAWQEGEQPTVLHGHPDALWQSALWQALVASLTEKDAGQVPRYEALRMAVQGIAALTPDDPRAAALIPKHIFIFGLSSLAPELLGFFQSLAAEGFAAGRVMAMHVFVVSPSEDYWGDVVTKRQRALLQLRERLAGQGFDDHLFVGNPLLASWGRQGKEFIDALHDLANDEIHGFVAPDAEGGPQCLLHLVQEDIYRLQGDDKDAEAFAELSIPRLDPDDGSIQFHSCHSPMREVEVLHDRLLDLFQADATLTAKDVIVMTPQIDSYLPYIHGVFGVAGARHIPYSVSDHSLLNDKGLIAHFVHLFTLHSSRMTLEQVFDVLAFPAVGRRFGLDEEERNSLFEAAEASGVRWGLDDAMAATLELPPLAQNTWEFGLDRMIAGYGMDALAAGPIAHGVAPFEVFSGQEGERLGRLWVFVRELGKLYGELQKPRTVAEWGDYGRELLAVFFSHRDTEEMEAHAAILETIQTVVETAEGAGFVDAVAVQVFHAQLSERLMESRISQSFLVGKVNFCTLMPMRAIPFRIVCLLGMNDGDFPRRQTPIGFDLLSVQRRKGDRNRRDEDRYLFLEALLSARDVFYVSFVGRSMRDNSVRSPSVLVRELQDYLIKRLSAGVPGSNSDSDFGDGHGNAAGRTPVLAKKALHQPLQVQHPMQPFSPSAYDAAQPERQSYDLHWPEVMASWRAAPAFFDSQRPLPPMDAQPEWVQEIELEELIRFYQDPVKYFFNKRLQVFLEVEEQEELNHEPFVLDSLESFAIKQELLHCRLLGEDFSPHLRALKKSGRLPVGAFAESGLVRAEKDVDGIAQSLQHYLPYQEPRLLEAWVGEWRVYGRHHFLTSKGGVLYRPAKNQGKYHLQAWLWHLLANAAGLDQATMMFVQDGAFRFSSLSREDACAHLRVMLAWYEAGWRMPLSFQLEWAGEREKNAAWSPAWEEAHLYLVRAFGETGEGFDDDAFSALAHDVIAPMAAAMEVLAEE